MSPSSLKDCSILSSIEAMQSSANMVSPVDV